jgi:hypothetical protein
MARYESGPMPQSALKKIAALRRFGVVVPGGPGRFPLTEVIQLPYMVGAGCITTMCAFEFSVHTPGSGGLKTEKQILLACGGLRNERHGVAHS